MKILGIDWGERKIGLAISEGYLASPLGTIAVSDNVLEKIKILCQKEGVGKIVVGVAEGKISQKQKEFGKKLARALGLEVLFWDETLTTQEAIKKMIEAGRGRKKRQTEDAFSAALILESFLEGQKK